MPIGKFTVEFVPRLLKRLEATFEGFETRLESPWNLQAEWYDDNREQYRSTKILQSLSSMIANNIVDRLLGITNVDLCAPLLNFVFGEAECPGNVAVISIFRLDPKFYGQTDGLLLFQRALKEAVHELGHTFGLVHCKDSNCVMFFSNSIYDTDEKHETFCNRCSRLVNNTLEGK